MAEENRIFDTDKRIKLGIWGLGRGQNFIYSCKYLNIDVVAGCDYNEHMRKNFKENCPDAFVTDDEDAFLAQDFDAVLIATWFCSHAKHAVKALKAGKHVMCEVTSFFTPAEAVELVEAVEQSGKVYNLLENYPFSKNNLFVRKLWQDGFFGDLIYAEYNYVHECRSLEYTYIDGVPVKPGWTAHNWRSWLNGHYYNTHSLGPVMQITGTRPVRVTSLPCGQGLAGYLNPGTFGITPSLIEMDNGGLVRNLMGAVTKDSHDRRLWGTLAAVDLTDNVKVTVGGSGHGRTFTLNTKWDALGEQAEKAGHGGGDFWELYYFARQILTGEKAPWDIYSACDVTMAGIMAYKSTLTGKAEEIPDFRDKAVREKYRNDHFRQEHMDPNAIFPEGHDTEITKDFSTVMSRMNTFWGYCGTILVRNVFDGIKIANHFASAEDRIGLIEDIRRLIRELPDIAENFRKARRIQQAYPDCLAGRAIESALAAAYEDKVLDTENTIAELRKKLEEI